MNKNSDIIIKDFIGIFPKVVNKEYCETVIRRFDFTKETRGYGQGNIKTRQQNDGVPTINKESDMYFFESEPDVVVVNSNWNIVKEFNDITWKCYDKFREKYGILDSLKSHNMSYSIKIQKYKPSQGYHVWHCDSGSINNSRRMMVSTLYLNTVKSGGETEFLYQSMRIPPVQGTLALFPTAWTHPHRGNPPLEGNKYIMNSWLEFME